MIARAFANLENLKFNLDHLSIKYFSAVFFDIHFPIYSKHFKIYFLTKPSHKLFIVSLLSEFFDFSSG